MESFEDRVHKELKSKNIHNKNYLWFITFLLTSSLIAYYSYTNQVGVIAKQTIDKEFTVKNQDNLRELFQANIHNFEPQYEYDNREKSLYESVVIVQDDTPKHEDINEDEQLKITLDEGPEVEVNDEQIALAEIPMTSPEVQQPQKNVPKEEAQQNKPNVASKVKVVEKTKPTATQTSSKSKTVSTAKNSEVALMPETAKEFKLIKCYNLQSNKAKLTPLCQQRINTFLQAHKKASQFEVIGIIDLVDEKEVLKHNKYKNVYFLGKDRIKKAKAFIKDNLGEKVTILEHEYTLKTELENRGVVIRAYN